MRRRARECALQILYQLDVGKHFDPGSGQQIEMQAAMVRYWENFETVSEAERTFAEHLVQGVAREVAVLDEAITKVSEHWRLDRMDAVDRNLLRLAAYEILYCPDVPRTVSINEAIEIAKRFSGPQAAAFINGILDQLQSRE
jgi:transcription antitermination protein NusB